GVDELVAVAVGVAVGVGIKVADGVGVGVVVDVAVLVAVAVAVDVEVGVDVDVLVAVGVLDSCTRWTLVEGWLPFTTRVNSYMISPATVLGENGGSCHSPSIRVRPSRSEVNRVRVTSGRLAPPCFIRSVAEPTESPVAWPIILTGLSGSAIMV